ncbi:hypothetical protein Tco_0302837 [Tanacetum coccineum]
MGKLAFCDYHNMVAILEKTEHNTDFHQIVDFLEASHIRYALMVRPTVYVAHIQQFWSTARVETVDEATKIIATVNGRQRTLTESSIRRHLKLNDAEANETASPTRDDRHREAFPTATSLDAEQDMENIVKTSAMPHEASPRVTSLGSGEGKINQLKNRVKTLEDNEKRRGGFSQEDASNIGGMDQGEDLMTGDVEKSTEKGNVEKSTDKGRDNTDEATNVLSTLEVANVLSSRSFPTAAPAGVATASGSFPTTVSFTTASVTTPYTRRTRASRGIIIEPSHTTSVPTISAK